MRTANHTHTRLWAILILLLAMGLRFYSLAGQSLWSDEGNSVALAHASLAEIAARTAFDIHPPFYYWLLHGWIHLTGDSEVAVRSLSAFAALLLVAVTYRLGCRLMGRRAGLVAAFTAAVSPFQIYYAQETRVYALLALLGALTVWAAVEMAGSCTSLHSGVRRHCAGWVLLYVSAAALGLYTHYAFAAVLATTGLTGLLYVWQTRRSGHTARRVAGWVACQLAPMILYLPWTPTAWRQLTTWPAPAATQTDQALTTVWRTLSMGPTGTQVPAPWLVVLGLLGLAGLLRLALRGPFAQVALLTLYLGLPIGLTTALFKPAYLKFLLVAAPAWCLLVAAAVIGPRKQTPPRSGIVAAAAPFVGCLLLAGAAWQPLMAYYTDPAQARDDYRGVARYLEAVVSPQDAILLDAPGQQEVFGYYYRGGSPVYPLPRSRPLDRQGTLAEMESILARSRTIYAVYWATDESDPEGLIESWFNTHALEASQSWVGNLRLAIYAAPLPPGEWIPTAAGFGEHITLTGYRLAYPSALDGLPEARPGDIIQAELRWQTDAPLQSRYVVFLQALDSANHLVGQRDAPPAVPSFEWQPGQPVPDRHGLLIMPGTPPGEHRLIVGLYDAASGARLRVAAPDAALADYATLAAFPIERPVTPPPTAALRLRHAVQIALGPFQLIGYDCFKRGHDSDPEAPLRPGDPLHTVFTWRTQTGSGPARDWRATLRLMPASGSAPATENSYPLAGVDYPTTSWQTGEVVRAQYDLFVPAGTGPGTYWLDLVLTDEGAHAATAIGLCHVGVESN